MSSRDASAGLSDIPLAGSRHRDVALLFLVLAVGAVTFAPLTPASVLSGGAALALSLWMRRDCGRVRSIRPGRDGALSWRLADGRILFARPVAARMGRFWISVTLRPDSGRDEVLLLLRDQFADAGDFRRLRLWLRAVLRDDARDADAGWSDWRPRWFPGSRD
jgi:hypothetical protein